MYWEQVNQNTVKPTGKGWKLPIPKCNVLDKSSIDKLSGLVATDISNQKAFKSKYDEHQTLLKKEYNCGPRIKELRENIQVSTSRFIEHVDIDSEQYLHQIEAGEVCVNSVLIKSICEAHLFNIILFTKLFIIRLSKK